MERDHTGGGGKPPPYAVGINRPVRWFSVRTNGGTHRSRPTSYVGSSYVFVGDDAHIVPAVWSNDARYTRANPYQAVRKFDGAVCGPMWASAPTGRVQFNVHRRTDANPYRRRGQAPALRGRNQSACPMVFGAYQRRDTQVPPYEPHGQSVQECRAAPACAAVRNMGWFPTAPGQMRTGGGTHRSRPTNHMGSPSRNVGRHLRVPPCGIWDGSPPHRGKCVPAAGASPRPTRLESIGLSDGFRCVPTAGHIGPALRTAWAVRPGM